MTFLRTVHALYRLDQAESLHRLTSGEISIKEARKGFFVVAVLVKRWKITKKDI